MEDKIRVLKFLADKQQKIIADLQSKNDILLKENNKLRLAQKAATDEVARLCEEVAQNAENFAVLCRDAGDIGEVENIRIQNPSKHVVVDIRHEISNLLTDKRKPTKHEYSAKTRKVALCKQREATPEENTSNKLPQRKHVVLKVTHRKDSELENVERTIQRPAAIVENLSHSFIKKPYPPRSSDQQPQCANIEHRKSSKQEPYRKPGSSSIPRVPRGTRAVGTEVFVSSSSCSATGQPTTAQTLLDNSRTAARVAWRMLCKPISRS
jgi:hypothetical protein